MTVHHESDAGRPDERRACGIPLRNEKRPACWLVELSPVMGEIGLNTSFSLGACGVSAEVPSD